MTDTEKLKLVRNKLKEMDHKAREERNRIKTADTMTRIERGWHTIGTIDAINEVWEFMIELNKLK